MIAGGGPWRNLREAMREPCSTHLAKGYPSFFLAVFWGLGWGPARIQCFACTVSLLFLSLIDRRGVPIRGELRIPADIAIIRTELSPWLFKGIASRISRFPLVSTS